MIFRIDVMRLDGEESYIIYDGFDWDELYNFCDYWHEKVEFGHIKGFVVKILNNEED